MTTLAGADWRTGFQHDARVLQDRSVRVVFGVDGLDRVGEEALRLGRRALLVAGPHEDEAAGAVGRQLGDRLLGRLRDVVQHVPVELAGEATARAESLGVDVLVALGGGSSTGLAKAVARQTGSPILAVPTTYAGSEMTPVWGLTDDAGKRTGRDPGVLPATVVYDPLLTFSLPAGLTAASGMNALAHAVEAMYAPETLEEADDRLGRVAEEAVRALADGLPRAVAQPAQVDARAQTLYGAWLAGWSLGGATMGLHHKLAHVLGGGYRLPHAGVHSALLPQVAAFNAPAAGARFERVARGLGVGGPDRVGPALFDLASRLGAPTSLSELGFDQEAIEDVAAEVAGADVTNPRAFTEADLVRLLRDAHEGRHP